METTVVPDPSDERVNELSCAYRTNVCRLILLLGTAPAVDVVVGPEGSSGIVLAYDTGIR